MHLETDSLIERNEPPVQADDTPSRGSRVYEGDAPSAARRRRSPFAGLARLIFGTPVSDDARLRELSLAIIDYPRSPANYVLRGELYLHYREYARAEADFKRALLLAAEEVETADWGILAQAMQDRALAGWQTAVRHLPPE